MKFCGIFFGALAYISAYSLPLRKIMRKNRFKGKFMGEITGTQELDFLGFGAFFWHKEMKSRGLSQNWHFHTTSVFRICSINIIQNLLI